VEIGMATDDAGEVITTGNDIKRAVEQHDELSRLLRVEFPYKNDRHVMVGDQRVSQGATGVIWFPADQDKYRFVMRTGGDLLFGPGLTNTGQPFHTLGMILSFFVIWAITGMAQPSTMVRLMAFQESKTLNRAILTVTLYFALIYLPLIAIVMAARSILPILTPEDSDRAIVLVATQLVSDMGIPYQILGAIFIAAPFAAVMSTVDSMLLLISSCAVRDIYQRTINPRVRQRTVTIISYTTTAAMGILITIAALRPPDFLQKLIIFGSGGFAASFLFPTLLGLYWKPMTRQGALAAMLGGFATTVGLFLPTWFGRARVDIGGLHPNVWGLIVSGLLAVVVSKWVGPAPRHLVQRYFYR
jgi:SSS family solute:Na+ symporter/sodium/pantothenate symporter